jgi:hypothetical protein
MASPVLIVIDITDAAIFELEHEERQLADGSVSSFALPAATIVYFRSAVCAMQTTVGVKRRLVVSAMPTIKCTVL